MTQGQVGLVGQVGQVGRAGLKARATAAVVAVLVAQPFRAAIAQQPPANPLATFIKVQAPVVALVHARVIDGTGAPAREDQTMVIRDGNIAAIGDAARTAPPAGATIVDATGERDPRPRDDARAPLLAPACIASSGSASRVSRLLGEPGIADIRRVDTVFKNGVGFDPAKLIDSVKGQVGIW